MATLTGSRAASTYPVPKGTGAGNLKVAWGSYNIATALSQNDIVQFCRVPAGAVVIGGYVQGKDIDTGTEAFDFDIGWAANGTEALDADGFGNFGVWDGDAVAQLRPEAGIFYPLGGVLLTTGPQTFTNETIIQGTCNAAANAGGTGILTVVVFFV